MTTIACTLTGAEQRRRRDALAALAAEALRQRERTRDGARLTFGAAADVEAALRAIIAAEASCCPFLTMTLAPRGGHLVLEIAGPPEAEPLIAALFA